MIKKIYYVGIRVLVIVVYSALIVKVFGVFKTDRNTELKETPMNSVSTTSRVYKKEKYQLNIKNNNPFLASEKQIKKTKETFRHIKAKEKRRRSKPTLWPNIVYYGFVKSGNSKKKRVVLKVNDKIYKKKEYDKVNDVVILKAYKDSLKVKLNNDIKTFRRFYEK